MNTQKFQNILAILYIYDFCPSVNYISTQWKIYLKYHRNRDPKSVNGEGSSDNAPQ
jgi:hypothetical protein